MLKYHIVPVTQFEQNCTILVDTISEKAVVVDPGGDLEKILAALKGLAARVEAIWLTHGHFDHAGAAMAAKGALDVPIFGPHRADKLLLDELAVDALNFGSNEGIENCQPDFWLNEGDTLTVGNLTFTTLHLPGHTPGHVAFYNREEQLACVGDVLFKGSIGRTDFPGASYDELMNSIRSKLLKLPDETTFICGHGPISTIGKERKTNPFLRELRQ